MLYIPQNHELLKHFSKLKPTQKLLPLLLYLLPALAMPFIVIVILQPAALQPPLGGYDGASNLEHYSIASSSWLLIMKF